MSRRRSSRHSKSPRNKIRKANNILVVKLVDPIVQSLLFIFFIYSFDSDIETLYQTVLSLIVYWQVTSCIGNLILNPPEQLKKQRIAALIVMIAYSAAVHFALARIPEKAVVVKLLNNSTIYLYQAISQAGSLVIAFWYYIICFREIRAMLTSVTNEAS